jgi:cbb3-type cytochrome oxidase maturation protein
VAAIFIMIGASIIIAGGFLIAFIWSVKTDQFADDFTPSVRMLFDDLNQEKFSLEEKEGKGDNHKIKLEK